MSRIRKFPSPYASFDDRPKIHRAKENAGFQIEPCEECGHDRRAHDARNGILECLVHSCTICRDHSIIPLASIGNMLGARHSLINQQASKKPSLDILLDANDMLAIRKTELDALIARVGVSREKTARLLAKRQGVLMLGA